MRILYPVFVLIFTLCICIACGEKPKKKATKRPAKKAVKETKSAETAADTKAVEEVVPVPPEQLAKAKEIIEGASEEAIAAVDAKKKFKMYCATCHGFTGNLNVNGAKDLTKSKIDLEGAVAQVYHGRGLMTPFKGIMEDAEIVAVAKYIETLRK